MTTTRRLTNGIRATLLVLLLAAFVPAATAAQSTPEVDPDTRTIVVEGTASVDAAPDTADVSFGVRTQNESLETAQDENSTRTQALLDALSAAGIAQEDISTSSYAIRVINEFDRDGNLVGVTGYEVLNQVTVTIRDLSVVGSVLDDAVGAGANEVSSISFYVNDTDAAASQARTAAIDNARAKADEMADAAGVIVTGVFSIEETAAPEPPSKQYDMAAADTAESAAREVPVSPGQAQISVTVRVVFQIDQPQG